MQRQGKKPKVYSLNGKGKKLAILIKVVKNLNSLKRHLQWSKKKIKHNNI